MAIRYRNKIIRNLEEQVRKNQKDSENLLTGMDSLESDLTIVKNNIQTHTLTKNIMVAVEEWNADSKEVTINVEGAGLNYINEISASADNGTNIINNAKNVATARITVLEQTEDNKITLRCEELPTESLYFDVLTISNKLTTKSVESASKVYTHQIGLSYTINEDQSAFETFQFFFEIVNNREEAYTSLDELINELNIIFKIGVGFRILNDSRVGIYYAFQIDNESNIITFTTSPTADSLQVAKDKIQFVEIFKY